MAQPTLASSIVARPYHRNGQGSAGDLAELVTARRDQRDEDRRPWWRRWWAWLRPGRR